MMTRPWHVCGGMARRSRWEGGVGREVGKGDGIGRWGKCGEGDGGGRWERGVGRDVGEGGVVRMVCVGV